MTTNRQNQHPAAIDAEKPTDMKTKTRRATALLLMLLMLAPAAAWAQVTECRRPTELAASNIESNSAILSWVENGPATSWIVAYATSNDNNFTEVNAPTNPFTLTGLVPATQYIVKVLPVCEVDKWSDEITFTTPCGPITITADAPYTQGFESPDGTAYNVQGPLPDCWDGYKMTVFSIFPHNTIGSYSHSGAQSLSFRISYALLPIFSNPINELQISFWMIKDGPYSDQLQLGYITADDNGKCNTFTEIASYDCNVDSMVQRISYLPNVPDTAYRLAFKYFSSDICYIDDLEVALAPDCYPVGNLSVGEVSSTSAYLSWELFDNNQTAWNVQVATDEAFTNIVADEETDYHENYLVEGLNDNTQYYVRVKPTCSTDFWSTAIDFTTECGPIEVTADAPYTQGFESPGGTNYDESGPLPSCWDGYSTQNLDPHNMIGNGYYSTQSLSLLDDNGYAIFPEFSNPINELQINFWMSTSGVGHGQLQLGYLTAEDDGTCNTFTSIETYDNSPFWVQRTTYLLNVPATAQRLAFKWNAMGLVFRCNIDDVKVSICTLDCFPVGALSVDNFSSNSAHLSWDLIDYSQEAWNVQLATNATFTNILVDEETDSYANFPLEDLSIGIYYYLRVKPTCSDDLWNVLEFALPCALITVTVDAPYTQGFESPESTATNEEVLPPCWEAYCTGIGYDPHNSRNQIHNSTQSLAFYNVNFAYALLPEFSNPLNQLQVSFWMKTNNDYGTLHLGYLTAEDDGTCNSFTSIATYNNNYGNLIQQSTVLDNVPAEAERLVFRWCGTGIIRPCYIDDVEISINPALIAPHDIAAANITNHEADITWEGACGSYALRYREIPTILKEGFEGGTMPQGWTIEGDNQNPDKTWRVGVGDHLSSTGTHSGNYNARITHNTNNQVTYLVTPALDLGEYASAELSFWYINGKWDNETDEFAVCYRIGNEGEWNELWSTDENHEGWTCQTVALTGLADNCQIGFRYTDRNANGVGLDDITIIAENTEWITVDETESPHTLTGLTTETTYEVQVKSNCEGYEDWSETLVFATLEACPVPFNVEASGIAATSAAVSWTGFSDSYDLSYRQAPGTLLNEGFEGGTMPQGWTIEGDNQDPDKTWRVGVGDFDPATGTHSDNYNALITHNDYNQVTYLVTPALDLSEYGSVEISFWYVNRKWGGGIDELAVCYRIGNEGEWNQLWSTSENHQAWTSQTVALTGLASNYQIGFRFTDGYGYGVGLDDIVLFDMTHSNWITLSEAENPHTLTGLMPETEYEVKVQGVCEGEPTEWSESAYFTTLEGTTFTKDIIAHTDNGGWYLIASPVAEAVTPTAQNGFITNAFDLYRFNQSEAQGLEWENWKAAENYHFPIENGRGYLYASQENTTLTFTGTPHAATGLVEVPLAYDPAASFAGWNLVGNPLPEIAFIDRDFYVMNGDRDEIVAAEGNTVELMEGIFVIAEGENDTMTFTPASQNAIANNASLVVSLSQGRGSVIDRAIVRFDSNRTLPKFQLNPSSTKVYIPQGGKDYAVVAAEQTGEMPLNFKAEKNGTYTLRFDTKDVEFDYLHLIDNLTGADVDLLAVEPSVPEPVEGPNATSGNVPSTSSGTVASYTFTAKTTDYASRFRLVFNANDASTGSASDAPFAYINNGNIIINGTGTLQIIDILGKELERKELSTLNSQLSTLNYAPGVYVLRLVGGDSVRTQKIVID